MSMSSEKYVTPGDDLGPISKYTAGSGAYVNEGQIRATLCGKIVVDKDENGGDRVNVVTSRSKVADFVINVGDKVLCRVLRTNYNQVYVDILSVGDHMLPLSCKGVVRREDISAKEVDKTVISELFHGGDIIRASVISLGDNKQYYLSTVGDGLGVMMLKATQE